MPCERDAQRHRCQQTDPGERGDDEAASHGRRRTVEHGEDPHAREESLLPVAGQREAHERQRDGRGGTKGDPASDGTGVPPDQRTQVLPEATDHQPNLPLLHSARTTYPTER